MPDRRTGGGAEVGGGGGPVVLVVVAGLLPSPDEVTCSRLRRVTNSVLRVRRRCCKCTASFEDDASCSFLSVSQNFCSSVKYLSKMNTLDNPKVVISTPRKRCDPAGYLGPLYDVAAEHDGREKSSWTDVYTRGFFFMATASRTRP